ERIARATRAGDAEPGAASAGEQPVFDVQRGRRREGGRREPAAVRGARRRESPPHQSALPGGRVDSARGGGRAEHGGAVAQRRRRRRNTLSCGAGGTADADWTLRLMNPFHRGFALTVIAVTLVAGCRAKKEEETAPVVTVDVAPVLLSQIQRTIRADGV